MAKILPVGRKHKSNLGKGNSILFLPGDKKTEIMKIHRGY